jgi:hypothetical protein
MSTTTALIRSALSWKWYEMSRVLLRPPRSAIRVNVVRANPSSATVSMVALMICVRRAADAAEPSPAAAAICSPISVVSALASR